ncbi:MAG TPA: ATP-binding cassette domain-containing protein [Candidatus Limnocylindrales bacterium]|nr:ATP-binding cassette domain-containing protein [Candidatus Limnocylindrales bacterium]
MIRFSAVGKAYSGTTVLRDIDVHFPPHRLTAILGPSGSGKSTLLRLAALLEAPDSGSVEVEIDGIQFRSGGSAGPWPLLTCVFQRQFLWPHLTVRQNVETPLLRLSGAERRRRTDIVLERFGLIELATRYPNELSGGEGQRVAIARAVALGARILLLDEVQTFLDLMQQALVVELLRNLVADGVTIVCVTHSLDFARRCATSIVVLDGGRVVEDGSVELLSEPQSAFLRRVTGLA